MKQTLGAFTVALLCLATFCLGVAMAPAISVQVNQAQVRQALSDDTVLLDAQDRINQEQINVFTDHVRLDVDNVKFAPVAATASMLPFLHSGSHTLELSPTSPAELHVGDVISYFEPEKEAYIVHAIIEVGVDEQGWFAITQGFNNPVPDAWKVRFDQIEGVLVGVLY